MLVVILSLAGVQDIMTLILSAGINAIAYCLIWMAINNFGAKKSYSAVIFNLGVVAILLPWLLVLIYSISTLGYGGVRSPWFVYGLDIVGLFSTAIVIYGYWWHKEIAVRKAVVTDEIYPILTNQIVKVLFAINFHHWLKTLSLIVQ